MGRIVLAEDDSAFCYAVAHALRQAGHEVQAFENSIAAWAALDGRTPVDLVITDIVFPAGQPSGVALANGARQHHRGLPVIFITAYDDAAQIALEDARLVLRKPVDLHVLLAAVTAALG